MADKKEHKVTATHMIVYSTDDYGMFMRLVGNREVTNKRVAIIKASIKKYGYISNPIITNEKMEIIDGQGRCEALRQLKMPVEYRIIEGLGVDECRAMNLKPTGWSLDDFIFSYADQGVKEYVELRTLHNISGFGYRVIANISKGHLTGGGRGLDVEKIKEGEFEFDDLTMQKTMDTLNYLQDFKEVQKKVKGRADTFYTAVAWVSNRPGVDKDKLKNNVTNYYYKITPPATGEQTLKDISDCYNYKTYEKNKRDFDYEFKQQRREK